MRGRTWLLRSSSSSNSSRARRRQQFSHHALSVPFGFPEPMIPYIHHPFTLIATAVMFRKCVILGVGCVWGSGGDRRWLALLHCAPLFFLRGLGCVGRARPPSELSLYSYPGPPVLLLPSCPAHRTHIDSTFDSALPLDSTLAEETQSSRISSTPRYCQQGSKAHLAKAPLAPAEELPEERTKARAYPCDLCRR